MKFHEAISYQIVPVSALEGSSPEELKEYFYPGEVYKSTLIDSSIEKGEFTPSDLKDHLAFSVSEKCTTRQFHFSSGKIKYTQREIVYIFDSFS